MDLGGIIGNIFDINIRHTVIATLILFIIGLGIYIAYMAYTGSTKGTLPRYEKNIAISIGAIIFIILILVLL